MPIYDSVVDTIGKTPLIDLSRFVRDQGLKVRLLGKMESRNPCGSVKDRIGLALIKDAEERGLLKKGSVIVEATSGNTGIALASVAAALGYHCIIVMPENMSRERVAMLRAFGAEVVLTRGALMSEAVARARRIVSKNPEAVLLKQFENPANPAIHVDTTAEEIWSDADGKIDVFVAGVGTGGTISGVGRFLKGKNEAIQIIAVEPEKSAVLCGKRPGAHHIQGIGAGFVPDILDREVIDDIIAVSEKDALSLTIALARSEGILAGISSGANLAGAAQVAQRPELEGKTIALLLCDTGERYLSTPLADMAVR